MVASVFSILLFFCNNMVRVPRRPQTRVFAQTLCKSWPKFGAPYNAVAAGALAGVHVGPCMGITSCVPWQARLLWSHVRLSVKWRGMAWALSCRMGECSLRVLRKTHIHV
uniref:Secreted protein n=1 Tax=Rhipicephalus appendiculatus TaxID=34631 RepID=A0A131YET2_RHIAP